MKLTRCSGFWAVVLAATHVAMTPVFYRESARSVVDGGVLGALDADPDLATHRGASFWYVTAGIFQGLVGLAVLAGERRGEGAPRGFATAMAVTGTWGVLLSPLSGFWLFFPIAWLARRNSRNR